MRTPTLALAALILAATSARADEPQGKAMTGPLAFKLNDIAGKEVDLAQYKGKVVLIVNVASQCGYTKQYRTLQELYERYKGDGLVVIGVPANDFGAQEPGTNEEIAKFCQSKYSVTFPMMEKVVVKGEGATPLYHYLTGKDTDPKFAGEVGWNFEKFLISRQGEVVGRFKSSVDPLSDPLVRAVKAELAAGKE